MWSGMIGVLSSLHSSAEIGIISSVYLSLTVDKGGVRVHCHNFLH